MKAPDWNLGVRLAVTAFLMGLLLAVGSYGFGCWIYGSDKCGLAHGVLWILHHPVFPEIIPAMVIFGFVFGAFGEAVSTIIPRPIKDWLARPLFAWIVIVLLIMAWVLWVLPEVLLLLRS